jgi:hypothetical protein
LPRRFLQRPEISLMHAPVTSARRKLPHHAIHIVMPLLLSIIMTFVITLISTLTGVGTASPAFHTTWMKSWGFSWIVAFPTIVFVLPLVRKLVGMLVEPPPSPAAKD